MENEGINFESLEAQRKKVNKKNIIFYLIGGLLIVLAVVLFFFEDFSFLAIIAIIPALLLFVAATINKKRFTDSLKGNLIAELIKEELGEDAVYNINGGIDLNEINSLRVASYPDRYHFEDHICAKYNDIPYEMCDCVFEEKVVTRDSKGNVRVSYKTYFKGRIIKIDFKRDLDVTMKIVNEGTQGFTAESLQKFETEVIEFNKKFKTYVSDSEKGFYILTPHMISKMQELERMFTGGMTFVFKNGIFYTLINNYKSSLEVDVSKKFDEEQIKRIRSEILLGASIINEFRLDKDKYNTNYEN